MEIGKVAAQAAVESYEGPRSNEDSWLINQPEFYLLWHLAIEEEKAKNQTPQANGDETEQHDHSHDDHHHHHYHHHEHEHHHYYYYNDPNQQSENG